MANGIAKSQEQNSEGIRFVFDSISKDEMSEAKDDFEHSRLFLLATDPCKPKLKTSSLSLQPILPRLIEEGDFGESPRGETKVTNAA